MVGAYWEEGPYLGASRGGHPCPGDPSCRSEKKKIIIGITHSCIGFKRKCGVSVENRGRVTWCMGGSGGGKPGGKGAALPGGGGCAPTPEPDGTNEMTLIKRSRKEACRREWCIPSHGAESGAGGDGGGNAPGCKAAGKPANNTLHSDYVHLTPLDSSAGELLTLEHNSKRSVFK